MVQSFRAVVRGKRREGCPYERGEEAKREKEEKERGVDRSCR